MSATPLIHCPAHEDAPGVARPAQAAAQRLPALPDVLAALHAGSLAPHAFDHRAHLFAAWSALLRYGVVEGAARFRPALRAYTAHLQAADKYHVTITEALLRLVAAALSASADSEGRWQAQWQRFERRHAALFRSSREVLADYYSDACLLQDEARLRFVRPDLRALPLTALDGPGME